MFNDINLPEAHGEDWDPETYYGVHDNEENEDEEDEELGNNGEPVKKDNEDDRLPDPDEKVEIAEISEMHSGLADALEYWQEYGYYMVDCPYCGETHDVEIDFEGELECIDCEREFKVISIK